jgi:hypothetical protein
VRAVFNLALGSDNPVNKRTASNALLQMLNTICKRVTQIQPRLTGGSSECSSRTASEALDMYRSTSGMSFYGYSPAHTNRASGTGLSNLVAPSPSATLTAAAAAAAAATGQLQPTSSDAASAGGLYEAAGGGEDGGGRVSSSSTASASAAAARAAQLAALAERKDLRGLEAALEEAAGGDGDEGDSASSEEGADHPRSFATAAAVSAGLQSLSESAGGAAAGTEGAAGGGPAADSSLQRQPSVGPAAGSIRQQQQHGGGRSVPGTPSHGRHSRHSHRLSTQERDVLLVLTAFCKLASREVPGATSSDSVLAQGKLLALEMLAKVNDLEKEG